MIDALGCDNLRIVSCRIPQMLVLLIVYIGDLSYKSADPPIIGEEKPENQSLAIIFTRGEALQTINMNQVMN